LLGRLGCFPCAWALLVDFLSNYGPLGRATLFLLSFVFSFPKEHFKSARFAQLD